MHVSGSRFRFTDFWRLCNQQLDRLLCRFHRAVCVGAVLGTVLLFSAIHRALGQQPLSLSPVQTSQSQQILSLLLQEVNLAFSPTGKVPNAVTLNGTADWTAGSTHESGTVSLKASLDGSTSESWSLSTQSHTLTQGSLAGTRDCQYADSKSKRSTTDASCVRNVPWFSPWTASALLPANLTQVSLATQTADVPVGKERIDYSPVLAIKSNPAPRLQAALNSLKQATTVQIAYDAKTGLPLTLSYLEMTDSEPAHAIQVSISFGNFASEAGFILPHHLQRYVQRSLQADIHVTSVTVE